MLGYFAYVNMSCFFNAYPKIILDTSSIYGDKGLHWEGDNGK